MPKLNKYRGVCLFKNINRYHAWVHISGKQKYVGTFDTEMEAAIAREKYILNNKLFCVARNFPEMKFEDLDMTRTNPNAIAEYVKQFGESGVALSKINSHYSKNVGSELALLVAKGTLEKASNYDHYFFAEQNKVPAKKKNYRSVNKSTSKYRGVSYYPGSSRSYPWRARITVGGKTLSVGYYATEEAAARAYDACVVKHNYDKELNFPREKNNREIEEVSTKLSEVVHKAEDDRIFVVEQEPGSNPAKESLLDKALSWLGLERKKCTPSK